MRGRRREVNGEFNSMNGEECIPDGYRGKERCERMTAEPGKTWSQVSGEFPY